MVFRNNHDIQIETQSKIQSHIKCSSSGERFEVSPTEMQIDTKDP